MNLELNISKDQNLSAKSQANTMTIR